MIALFVFFFDPVENTTVKATCNCEQLNYHDKLLTCKFPIDITDGKHHVRAYCGDILPVASCPYNKRDHADPKKSCDVMNTTVQYISQKTLSLKTWVPGNNCSCRIVPEQSGEFEDCECQRTKSYDHGVVLQQEDNVNVAARVGGVFGTFIFICLLVALIYFIYQKCIKAKIEEKPAEINGLSPLDCAAAGGDTKSAPPTPEIITSEKVHLVQAEKSPLIIPDIIADGEVVYDDVTMLNIPFIDASTDNLYTGGEG